MTLKLFSPMTKWYFWTLMLTAKNCTKEVMGTHISLGDMKVVLSGLPHEWARRYPHYVFSVAVLDHSKCTSSGFNFAYIQ